MRRRFVHLVTTLGLLAGMLAGVVGSASAAPDDPSIVYWLSPAGGSIFFPWVPNDDSLAGIDGVTGSVTVQNIEIYPVDVTLYDAAGNELTSITLNPRASQTWTADQLGIAAPGAGVVATGDWAKPEDAYLFCTLSEDLDIDFSLTRGATPNTNDSQLVPNAPGFIAQLTRVYKVVGANGFVYPSDSYNASLTFDSLLGPTTVSIDWSPEGPEPAAGETYDILFIACTPPRLAGVEKHAVGTVGPRTTANTEMVDGYSALPWIDLALAGGAAGLGQNAYLDGQSRWILPIVQTNNGWNTEFVITNIAGQNNSVNATFYPAGGQGVAGESIALISGHVLAPGESVSLDLLDYGLPEDMVGSVWIDASRPVVAGAFRNKPSTEMMLTTLAQPRTDLTLGFDLGVSIELFNPTERFGPLVFRDYNGWNTGINIANLSSEDNQVSVTYYNYAGNVVAAETRTIPARAMEYVYTPATGNFGVGENQITAVRIQGTAPLAAAIDEVKYLGGQGQGHAMSYPAAGKLLLSGGAELFDFEELDLISVEGRYWYLSALSLPLVQKGNPQTGTGDTSGINLFNSNPEDGITAYVQFLDSAGVPVAPTVNPNDSEKPLMVPLGPHAGATIYTLNYSEMPAGFQGSAVVGSVCPDSGDDDLPFCLSGLVGVSNNVNYDVAGDGSAAYNLVQTYGLSLLSLLALLLIGVII